MKIGLLSDTHDNINKIKSAVEFFKAQGIKTVLHCGDHSAPFALLPFKNSGLYLISIWGNNEGEKEFFLRTFASIDGEHHQNQPYRFELEGRRILMMHEPNFLDIFENSGEFDLICYGHLHKIENRKENGVLVVNPGETCGYLTGKSTVAIIDLIELEAKIYEI